MQQDLKTHWVYMWKHKRDFSRDHPDCRNSRVKFKKPFQRICMRRTTHQSVYTQHPHCSYSNIHGHRGSSITDSSPLPHQVHLCRWRCACSITAAWSQQPLIMFPDVEGIFYHLAACPSSACQRESIHCKDGNHGNCSYIVI